MQFSFRRVATVVLVSAVILLAVATWVVCDTFIAREAAPELGVDNPTSLVQIKFFPPMSMDLDLPGIRTPQLVPAGNANLGDEELVIGVVVEGISRAYLRKAFDGHEHHVVNDLIGIAPISVTHCDLTRCTRVLTQQQASDEQPLGIRIGGWDHEYKMMMIIVNEKRYLQFSPEIPLLDVPFSEVTWGEWRREHPESLIYLGPSLDS